MQYFRSFKEDWTLSEQEIIKEDTILVQRFKLKLAIIDMMKKAEF